MTNMAPLRVTIILVLFICNAFTLGQWAANEKQLRAWQQLAIAEDNIILQQEEALKSNADSMDKCFNHIGGVLWKD